MVKVSAVPGMQPFVVQKQSKERAQTANAQKVQSVPSFQSNSNANRAALAYGTVRVKSDTSFKGSVELIHALKELRENPSSEKALSEATSCIEKGDIKKSSLEPQLKKFNTVALNSHDFHSDEEYCSNLRTAASKLKEAFKEKYGEKGILW